MRMRGNPTSRARTRERRDMISELAALWAKIVLGRANYRCEVTGETPCQAHHIVTKGHSFHLRFDPDNGICLAVGFHRRYHDGSIEDMAKLWAVVGEERRQRLISQSAIRAPRFNRERFEEIRERLQGIIEAEGL